MIICVWVFSIFSIILRYDDVYVSLRWWVWKHEFSYVLMSFEVWWGWGMIYVIYDEKMA